MQATERETERELLERSKDGLRLRHIRQHRARIGKTENRPKTEKPKGDCSARSSSLLFHFFSMRKKTVTLAVLL